MIEAETIFTRTWEKIIEAHEAGRQLGYSGRNGDKIKLCRNEFARRQWLWAEKLEIDRSEIWGRLPNLLRHLNAEEYIQNAENCFKTKWENAHSIRQLFGRGTFNFPFYYAAWEVVKGDLKFDTFNLPHPYQPILWLFENGALKIEFEGGAFYAVPGGGISFGDKEYFLSHEPFISENKTNYNKNRKWSKSSYPFRIFKKKIR